MLISLWEQQNVDFMQYIKRKNPIAYYVFEISEHILLL